MTSKQEKKLAREIAKMIEKAKIDTADWASKMPYVPSDLEIKAFQAGYIYGINRGSND